MHRKPQTAWAMVDERGYIFPHYVRSLKKEVIEALNKRGPHVWGYLKAEGRTIVKINLEKLK